VQERGRTFTFRLRPGARYSSGAPVRLEDFRSSIERQYLASTGLAAVGVPIVGAESCTAARCDLSRGVVLDDAARTITFRLSAPDPAFLYQLALPFGAVVPTGSPAVGTSARPLPATGPYIIERYEPGRVVVLRRNRRFHSWSAAAQPEGFPDRIAFALGLDATRQAAAVSAGRADVMLDSPTLSRLSQLERHAPLQLHRSALPEVLAMFLNTRHPPFDDPRVRRALGLAVDRAAVVRIAGGARVARATCQILPPTFPGYQPFCPSTAAPNAAGVWRAPDLERARQLIASSGTAGMPVRVSTVRTDERRLATARYFVLLLRSLGYQTTLRAYDSEHAYYGAVGLASSNSQIGVFGWAADYEAGSAFFQPLFTCTAYTPTRPFGMNAAAFCDPELDREIADATALQLTNVAAANAAWARVDRQVTSRAPWIPLVNPIAIDFVSSRVGNYMRNPAFGILLDQLWVR
jgi:peptide/nickel transport system substrate-binding protein